MDADTAWVAGIAVVIICGLIGIIYWAGQNRDDKQDTRAERNEAAFTEHVKEDARAHERLSALETDMANVKTRLRDIGKSVHDAREAMRIAIAEVYKFLTEKILDRLK